MNRIIFIFLLLLSSGVFSQELKLTNLRCNYRINPLGIDIRLPMLSWELQSSRRGVMQTAYRILVADDTSSLEKNIGMGWDSKKIVSGASIQVAYTGPALLSAKVYYWKVMVWDNRGDSSRWSKIAYWQTGLTSPADWKGAQWIAYEDLPDSARLLPGVAEKVATAAKGMETKKTGPFRDTLPLFRKEFVIGKPLRKATAFICGLGHFEMSCNGKKTGDHFLDPGWTDYDKKALYVTFDITGELKQGPNAIGVMLGNGFYYVPRQRYHKLTVAYGYPKLIARIFLEYADGSSENIVSNLSWKTIPGPLLFSSIYGGEDYDARREQPGWDIPGFNDKNWQAPVTVTGPPVLEAQSEEPLKIFDIFSPRTITRLRPDSWIYDLGQNASGIPQITVSGEKGKTIRIVPAELMNEDSTANQKATGKPYYFEYTLKGDGMEQWQPRFSYYGFRYLQIEGAVPEGEPNPNRLPVISALKGLHTRNAAERVGKFNCSDHLLRRTDTLIDWAIRSNMASVFTDCPHREKLGWLEEAHLMGSSIRYNYDIAGIGRKIVHDMMDAQTAEGLIPEIAPEFVRFGEPFRDSPEWGSSSILVPWYLYQWYGDKETLTESYPMMQRYVAYLGTTAKDNILYQGLGDWFDIGPARPGVSQLTPKGVTATAIYYYDLIILERVARLLGKDKDIREYEQRSAAVKTAFQEKFFNRQTHQVASGSQAANAIAVYMGLIDPADKDAVVANIVKDIRDRHNSLTAGDIGFRYLEKVLDQEGRADVIYDMNSRTDVPGYGYQLSHGATALTESWQAYPSVSNNHLMLGHLMEWLYSGLAGIVAGAGDSGIAFQHSIIRPQVVGNIQWAQADYHSPYGVIASYWKKTGTGFDLSVTIPANTAATVYLPAPAGAVLTEGWKKITGRTDIRLVKWEKGIAMLEIGSGNYLFRAVTGNTVSEKVMEHVYEEVKTPYKYGLVMVSPDKTKKMDCPTIFRKGLDWYMTYIIYDGRGYETWLAKSPDLLHWKTQGRILSFTDSTSSDSARWDANQKAGYNALEDSRWGGSYQLQPYRGKYWMSYFGGNTRGYEAGMLSEGMAFTDKDPAVAHEWQRLDKPILTVHDSGVAWWDNHTMYKSWVVWDKALHTGHPFMLYYNANGDSINRKRGSERIGVAVSDDMVHWKRWGRDPVLDHLTGITGDAYIQQMGKLWVMFYFGAFWQGTHGAFNRFACSYDGLHWTDWTGPDLIAPSEPYDEVYAHKSFVIKYNGVVYHFYCAVDKRDDRGIAVATSVDKGKSGLTFHADMSAQPRITKNFDTGWRFLAGDDEHAKDADYDDSKWRRLDLPHDWSIEGSFSAANTTGQQEGGLPAGVGWYRKRFQWKGGTALVEAKVARVFIDFDGVYRNSEVWINGHYLGKRPNGYISFEYELTPYLNPGGENVLSVRVDNSQQPNSRWYTGSGIYRHVWLVTTSRIAVDHWGSFVTTPEVTGRQARVHVQTVIRSDRPSDQPSWVTLQTRIYDATGRMVAATRDTNIVLKDSLTGVEQDLLLHMPHVWCTEDPYLYKIITTVNGTNGREPDSYTTPLGIRTFHFDSASGFFLNGRPLKIRGVCMHHDLGALGAAVNTRAMERQLEILKAMGCNGIRTAHNPPAPEFLDLCDKMGFIVMDEAFDMWRKKKNKYDYSQDFSRWHVQDLEDQVRRDRNHPSVFIWSIGNEIREQFDSTGSAIAKELVGIVKGLDSTRPVTSPLSEPDAAKNFIYRSGALDLVGLNYHPETYVDFPRHFPGQSFIAAETMSALATRGHYDMPSDSIRHWPSGAKQPLEGANPDWTVSAYDNVAAYWGSTHEETWKIIKKYPFLSGLYIWSGFDYLGEPVPYSWPARSSYYGIIDLAGFPKDVYYMYQSEWTRTPVLHLFPHWNWKKGQVVDVWAYYNMADEVELYLNGRSLGVKRKEGDALHVQWRVGWEPGELKAISRKDGKTVLVRTIRTAGPAARIALKADRRSIRADDKDLSFITVSMTDAHGVPVPDAANELHFELTGAGILRGVDNGYQADLESLKGPDHKAYNGLCLAIVGATCKAGKVVLRVSGKGLIPATLVIESKKDHYFTTKEILVK